MISSFVRTAENMGNQLTWFLVPGSRHPEIIPITNQSSGKITSTFTADVHSVNFKESVHKNLQRNHNQSPSPCGLNKR